MRKFCLFVGTLALISLVLLGCQANATSGNSNTEMSKVSISNSKGFGEVNTDFYMVYEDDITIETFQKAISHAVEREGIVNMIEPEFDLEIIYKDGSKQGYHLWVGEKGEKSALMKVEDTLTIYSISEEMTNQLMELLSHLKK